MKVKIIFDIEENEYICFIPTVVKFVGYGETEEKALANFLNQCIDNPIFNQKAITYLIQQLSCN